MMDRREALLLVERLKRRTRDPDVLTLCEYVHGTDVHGTIPGFRRPGDGTPPAVFSSALCPVCAARRAAETAPRHQRHNKNPEQIARGSYLSAELVRQMSVAASARMRVRSQPLRPDQAVRRLRLDPAPAQLQHPRRTRTQRCRSPKKLHW